MPTTVSIGDDLAKQLKPYEAQFPEILALGIREFRARHEASYHGVNSVLEEAGCASTGAGGGSGTPAFAGTSGSPRRTAGEESGDGIHY